MKIILYAIGDGDGTNLMKISTISILSGIAKWSSPCAGCWQSGGQWKNILRKTQVTMTNHWKFPIEGPQSNQISFGVANGYHIETRVGESCSGRKHPQSLREARRQVARDWPRGQEEGYESRTDMVLSNGMHRKPREELEDDGAILFGYIFMAYLDIGGEHRYPLPFDPRVWTLLSKKIL